MTGTGPLGVRLVIEVDPKELTPIGVVSADEAHAVPGRCHLAVSLQVIDDDGRWLMQRRAEGKSFGGLWSNSVCTHPEPGEQPVEAVLRRLREELGVGAPSVPKFRGSFLYRADDDRSGVTEYEWDHVYVVHGNLGPCRLDELEVEETCLLTVDQVRQLVAAGRTTPWFSRVAETVWQL